MKRRSLLKLGSLTGALALAGQSPFARAQSSSGPIKVGILHSLSGTMAISETSLKDTALMTIADINKNGGVMGRQIQPVVVDPASNWPLFAEKARQLLTQDKVACVFGCWTSVSRKSVLPVFEELNGLLYYPVQYEGEEMSRNVFYTGAAPNQQALPAVEYLMSAEGGGAKRFFLLGTDYVYPRTTNKILRAFLHTKGVKDEDIQEVYTPFGHSDYQTIVANIKAFAQGGKTTVVSTINGDSNVPFYKELGNQGLKATDVPVVAFSVGEEELRGIDTKPLVGHLAAWNYFMSVKGSANAKFKKQWAAWVESQHLPGGAKRVTNDPMEATFVGIHMWKQAVEKAKSTDVDKVRTAMIGQTVAAPSALHADDGRQPSFAQARDDRGNSRRRPIQHRLGNEDGHSCAALEPVHRRQPRQARHRQLDRRISAPSPTNRLAARRAPWSRASARRRYAGVRSVALRTPPACFRFRLLSMTRSLYRCLLATALSCWLAAAPAFALAPADVAPLAGDDFHAKASAIDALAAKPDTAARALLDGLADDRVLATGSGEVLIQTDGDDTQARDAVTGRLVAIGDAQPVMLNNLLRGKVSHALAGLRLASPDLPTRRAAVDALLANPDASMKPLVEAARAKETDPALKRRLDALWATTALTDPDPAKRLEAVKLVAGRHDLDFYPLLRPLVAMRADGAFAEPNPAVRAAAQRGIDELDAIERNSRIVGTLFAGVSLGSVLLLAALGLAITYGVIGVINMAHGEFLMIGAYATYVVQNAFRHYAPNAFDWYPLAAVPASFLAAAAVGVVLERLVLKRLYGRPLETLLTTFGASLVLMQGTRTLFGAQNVEVANPAWMTGGIAVMQNLILPYNRIVILAFSLTVVAIAWSVLTRTRLGLFVRAVTQNRSMAACVGVKTAFIDSYAFAFGAGIAGLGGCALSQIGNVGPDLGQSYIVDSFMAVVLGGVGQLAGTVLGSFGLGVLTKAIEPFSGAVLAKIAVLVLIVLFIQKRPQGLFALKGRSA